jgi:hypothetical protein
LTFVHNFGYSILISLGTSRRISNALPSPMLHVSGNFFETNFYIPTSTMNKKSLVLILVLFWAYGNKSIAQNIQFERIEYASFDVNSYRTKLKDTAFVDLYSVINRNGLIKVNNNDSYHNTHTYYTQRLTPSQLKSLDSIFNRKSLNMYLAKTKLEDNSFYAGSYDFFLVTYKDGSKDSLCIIAPFMSSDFQKVYDMLDDIYYSNKNIKTKPFNISHDFIKSLMISYFNSSYLPTIQNPPPFRSGN